MGRIDDELRTITMEKNVFPITLRAKPPLFKETEKIEIPAVLKIQDDFAHPSYIQAPPG